MAPASVSTRTGSPSVIAVTAHSSRTSHVAAVHKRRERRGRGDHAGTGFVQGRPMAREHRERGDDLRGREPLCGRARRRERRGDRFGARTER